MPGGFSSGFSTGFDAVAQAAYAHTADQIVRKLLIDFLLGADGTTSPSAAWPVHYGVEPDTPDAVITVYLRAGRQFARFQKVGDWAEAPGVMIRVRARSKEAAGLRCREIAADMDRLVYLDQVTLDGVTYEVVSMSRTSDVLDVGRETPGGRPERYVSTVNYMVFYRRL